MLADASVELAVIATGDDYRTVLKKDGVVVASRWLATEQQIMTWVAAIMALVGQDLYVRLGSCAGGRRCELLHLAARQAWSISAWQSPLLSSTTAFQANLGARKAPRILPTSQNLKLSNATIRQCLTIHYYPVNLPDRGWTLVC